LRNAVERLLILSSGKVVTAADVERLLPRQDGASPRIGLEEASEADSFDEFRVDAEKAFLLAKLRESDWNIAETAKALSMPRSNLYKRIEKYGLNRES
jgi:two-component system nitrogen regulation response regulator NtrX